MSEAVKYRKREFVNQLDSKVIRVYYRCTNCLSRIKRDYMEEITSISLFDLMEKYRIQS